MIYTSYLVLSGAVTVLTMATQLQDIDSLHSSSLPGNNARPIDNLTREATGRDPTKTKQIPDPSSYASQETTVPSTGAKDSIKGPLVGSDFYMCCQANPNSITIDHYYPPYACIFGPSTGLCPQGINSSFIFPWLCTAEGGWGVGQIVREPGNLCLEHLADICIQTCTYGLQR